MVHRLRRMASADELCWGMKVALVGGCEFSSSMDYTETEVK